MATAVSIEKRILSGSTNGLGVKVAATASTGTTIHTAVTGTTDIDLVTLYAVNTSANPVKLTLEWGTTTAADGNIEITIPPESGLFQLTDRMPLRNGLLVTAFAATANVILIFGSVDRLDY